MVAYENSYKIYDWGDTEDNDENKNKTKTADGVYDLFCNLLVGHPDWICNDRVDNNGSSSSSSSSNSNDDNKDGEFAKSQIPNPNNNRKSEHREI
jgi:hypothetical protein